jgi:hypothetical protein
MHNRRRIFSGHTYAGVERIVPVQIGSLLAEIGDTMQLQYIDVYVHGLNMEINPVEATSSHLDGVVLSKLKGPLLSFSR